MNHELVDETPSVSKRRPTFLTVLCILTFAASAYYFFEGVTTIFSSKSFDEGQWKEIATQLEEGLSQADPQTSKFLERVLDDVSVTVSRGINKSTTLGIITIAVALLSALGAYLMLNLNRKGFTVYVAAKIFGIILPLVILGINIVTGFIYALSALVSALFIILYAVNRKHMD